MNGVLILLYMIFKEKFFSYVATCSTDKYVVSLVHLYAAILICMMTDGCNEASPAAQPAWTQVYTRAVY